MPWLSSTFLGITRTTTLTCQRSQVGVLSRPSPECSCTSASTPHLTSTRAGVGAWAPAQRGSTIANSQEEFHDSMWMNHWRAPTDVPVRCGPVAHEDRVGLLARAGGLSHRREPRPRGALP